MEVMTSVAKQEAISGTNLTTKRNSLWDTSLSFQKRYKCLFCNKTFKVGLNIGVENFIAFFKKKDQKVIFCIILNLALIL